MELKHSCVLAWAAIAVLASQLPAFAQLEVLSPAAKSRAVQALDAEIQASASTPMAAHLQRAKAATGDKAVLASRVAADFDKTDKVFVHYAVPAMSDLQRLPDVYPFDGRPGKAVRIIAAKGEYEPGSFLVYPFQDLGKVSFKLTPFKTADGKVFPAQNLDLKFIKVWYQNKNAWYSYFGDTDFKLVPELLVNDEDLIRVDTEKKANYARLKKDDGTVTEKWINQPQEMDRRYYEHWRECYTFMPMRKDFRDAKTLQPVKLDEGAFKNFFLTAHVTEGIHEGLYQGAVELTDKSGKKLGSIPVDLKVLPFELPAPKSYTNPERDFLTASYSYICYSMIMEMNGGDLELAKKQLEPVLRDQVEHNQMIHWNRGGYAEMLETVEVMKKVGMRTDLLLMGPPPGLPFWMEGPEKRMKAEASLAAEWADKTFGHHNIYLGWGDEPGAGWIKQIRPTCKIYQDEGFKFIIATGNSLFYKAGYFYDWHNVSQDPITASAPPLWNQVDAAHVAWYANMHVGPENPTYNRMQYGMGAYLQGFSAFCNYAHHFGPYNDWSQGYRPMIFAYGIYDGVLDTIQWEGFREGVDDIRYATLMTDLARKAAKSDNIDARYTGRKALQYLAMFDYRHGSDLNACRREMTRFILQLRDLLAAE